LRERFAAGYDIMKQTLIINETNFLLQAVPLGPPTWRASHRPVVHAFSKDTALTLNCGMDEYINTVTISQINLMTGFVIDNSSLLLTGCNMG
jgi:hypothetical protein